MVVVDISALIERLNPFCRQALEEAGALCMSQRGDEVTVAHWLVKLLEQPQCDVRITLSNAGLVIEDVRRALMPVLPTHDGGNASYPSFSPLLIELLQEAWLLSSVELAQANIRSGAVLLAALLKPAARRYSATGWHQPRSIAQAIRRAVGDLSGDTRDRNGGGAACQCSCVGIRAAKVWSRLHCPGP